MEIKSKRFYQLYTIVLFVFIAEATDSNSNETSQEHRQSRVTGRIVKLYSGTRPEPILCAGEGFQSDPRDCAVFYRCMKSGSGKYTVFKFQCGPGTVYDPETEVCNHPRSTKRSECGGLLPPPAVDRINNNEIEGTQHEIPSQITDKPIHIESAVSSQATFTTVNPWTAINSEIKTSTKLHVPEMTTVFTSSFPWGSSLGHTIVDYTISPLNIPQNTMTQNQQNTKVSETSRTTTDIPHSSSRDNICTSDGFMGDTENCRKFYRCVANQRGTYTRFEFSCSESTVWDDDTQSCNHAWAVKRSRCGRSNQNIPLTSNVDVPQISSTDKTIQQQLQISYGSKVTQTQTQISNGSVIQNQTQINYGDRINQNKNTKAKQNQTQISHGSAISQAQTQVDYSGKGVQTQVQIDHSQQSSQMQIQVHESTTAGPSTASSTSHVNEQKGNRCEQSGFMGDINDCKKFYRCIDNGRGGYTKFEFSCGEGTVWDQSIEACNHAWAVKECGGKGPAETTSTTQAAISTSHSTQNYYTTVSTEGYQTTSELIETEDNEDSGYGHQNQNPSTSSSTTWSSTTVSSTTLASTTVKLPSNGNCQSSGFIGDPNDCKIFYRCVENGKGSFTKYEFKCGEGTVWDPDIEACNHAWAVKRCGGNASPDINNIKTTTEEPYTRSTALTENTIVSQSSTELPATQNDDYDTGYGSANNDFTSSTTTTTKRPPNQEPSVGTVCQSSGFVGDKNDCKKFYRCVDNGNGSYTRYEFTCGDGTVWDSKIEACNHAWAVEKCGGLGSVDNQEVTTQAKPTTTHEVVDSSSTEGDLNTGSSTLLPSTTSSTSMVTESVTTGRNDCIKSGFMGDQKDCKKFYRCVDNGKGSFTKYEFSCGEGTVWDQKIDACNHAWAVEKCGSATDASTGHHETTTQLHPSLSDEIDDGYPVNVDTGFDITTQSTTTYSTTESSKTPSEGNNCINNGFIGDKTDCKKFYRCVDDGKGGYTRYEFSCGEGTLWDQSIEACNHAWAVKDCGKTGNNTTRPSNESSTQATITSETEDQGYPSQSTEKTSTSTISSYPSSETGEACSKEGFIGDTRNCKKFYRCVDNGRGGFTKYEFICGEGTYWNQEILSCDHATSDKTCGEKGSSSNTHTSQQQNDEVYFPETTSMSSSSTVGNENEQLTQGPPASSEICISEGFYGDQNDCKKFYRCVANGKGSYTKYDFTCGDGTVWDQEIQACNHESSNKKCFIGSTSTVQTTENQQEPGHDISMTTASQAQHSTEKTDTSSTSTSSSNQCSSEGFFADPKDCKKFIRCVNNDKGGYTKYEFTCGEGTIWVQDILACDHDTGDATCSSQTTSKPLATEGHQQTIENNEVSTSTSKPQTIDKQEDEYENGNSNKPSQPGSGDCTSEGFYANKYDCKKFYRCVDNGQGGFTKYDFTCGEGTAWDSEIQSCNHINQVKTCHSTSETQPIMHDEDNSSSTESSSTTSPTASSVTASSGTTSSSTTAADTTTGNKDTCDNEGYFGDTQDCKKFYRCVDNGKGGYTKYDYTCGDGTIWDQDITTCNHPQDVVNPSCNKNQDGSATPTTTTSSSSSESSLSSETSASSESSSSSDTSSSTSPSSQSTTESSQGSGNSSQEETSKNPGNQNITCDKAGFYANPNDCKKFYRCVDWDGDGKRFSVFHFDCGEGTIWDPAVETCNHEESVYPPRDCSGSQSQSENRPPVTEGTTTTQEGTTNSQETTSTTQSSAEQTTQSTTTQSTTSDQTTTEKSTTSEQTTKQSTVSDQTTQQSTTSEQTTQQSSSSEQTTTQQSTTSEQTTTQQSTTAEQTTTQQPTTSEQTTTQQSTTSEQTTTQQSTASEQTTTQQSATSEQTTTEQSTTSEQTTTQQSITSEETTTQPSTTTSEQTTTQQSTTSEQTTTEQSTTSERTTTEQSTSSEQTTQESTTSEQTTQVSTTTEQSTTSESTTEQSTSTTESSTTEQSTTQQATTTEQSEQSTTQQLTSSDGTTTEQSTTEQSTTEQTNETTTESGPDENTSENKCPETDENQSLFVCPTSFKRHPKYCNLFYQCDEDDDTHDVKIAVFTCPNNTIYDESQTRCVEESKADKKCDGKIAQKRRFKRLDRHYKEPIVVTKESHACPSAGYFSFEKDSECSPAFLKCKTDKTNKLRGLVYQCPSGYVYWSISKRCEPMNRVRDCKRSQNNWTGRWEIPVERRNVAPP